MIRRSILVTIFVTVFNLVTGRPSGGPSDPQCHLMHEVAKSSDDYGEPIETYEFEKLSSEAQRVFKKAVEDGGYTTNNLNLKPPEFKYQDTLSVYKITYQNETHVLLTYTSSGCELK